MGKNIYEQLKEVLLPEQMDSYASDLYVQVTEASKKIVENYEYKWTVKTFKSNFDGSKWYDIPFAYTPFWERIAK